MTLCSVCNHGHIRNIHYGVAVCKACSMTFSRFVKNPTKLYCLAVPKLCVPGLVPSQALCRKCRIERCFKAGMKPAKKLHWKQFLIDKLCPIPTLLTTEKPFENEKFPKMTEISKHIHTHMRTIEQYYPHNDQIRGIKENDALFFSIEDSKNLNVRLLQDLHAKLYSLEYFNQFSAYHVEEFFGNLSPCLVVVYFWRSFKFAQKRQEIFMAENKNYMVPNVCKTTNFEGYYGWAKRSFPNSPPGDWEFLTKLNCEALADNMHVRSQIASLWAGHDAAFALFLYLLFVDRTMDFCSVKHVKARFGEMKKEIEAEMRMYFDESGFDGAMQMAKVKHFLDSVVDISPNVMAFRTTTQLYIEMYKMKKKT